VAGGADVFGGDLFGGVIDQRGRRGGRRRRAETQRRDAKTGQSPGATQRVTPGNRTAGIGQIVHCAMLTM
jgi:hypothetical protein